MRGPLRATLLLAALGAAPAAAERTCLRDEPVCLESERLGRSAAFVVTNTGFAPYSVEVVPTRLSNARPLVPTPFRAVVEAGEPEEVGGIVAVDPLESWGYRFEWSAALGSFAARHDDTWRYAMPFGGSRPRVLSQGVDGAASHRGPSRYAFDFAMPTGTPILAARAGRVVRVVDGRGRARVTEVFLKGSNHVQVLHDDGTFALYAHLRHGVPVRVGQRVAPGHVLGASGVSGKATGPHLHFMVWKRRADLERVSVPIRFDDGSARGFVPVLGVAYVPARSP